MQDALWGCLQQRATRLVCRQPPGLHHCPGVVYEGRLHRSVKSTATRVLSPWLFISQPRQLPPASLSRSFWPARSVAGAFVPVRHCAYRIHCAGFRPDGHAFSRTLVGFAKGPEHTLNRYWIDSCLFMFILTYNTWLCYYMILRQGGAPMRPTQNLAPATLPARNSICSLLLSRDS